MRFFSSPTSPHGPARGHSRLVGTEPASPHVRHQLEILRRKSKRRVAERLCGDSDRRRRSLLPAHAHRRLQPVPPALRGTVRTERRNERSILDSAFLEFGLPVAIRSDGGPPFASTGAARLTELSVWLLKLGIRVEIIAPGKPQQNGRLERLHRTLKAETVAPPSGDCRAQQRAFDLWRREYNHERPQQALQFRRPATIYVRTNRSPSSRRPKAVQVGGSRCAPRAPRRHAIVGHAVPRARPAGIAARGE